MHSIKTPCRIVKSDYIFGLLIALAFFSLCHFFHGWTPRTLADSVLSSVKRALDWTHNSDVKVILALIVPRRHSQYRMYDSTARVFEKSRCPEKRCIATKDRHFLPSIDMFDAIIFHHTLKQRTNETLDLPDKRSPKQIYIFYSYEPPINWHLHDYQKVKGFFNWTMTQSQTSDFHVQTKRYIQHTEHPKGDDLERHIEQFGREHKHLARRKEDHGLAWVVSHCGRDRAEIVKQLKLHVNVSIYGSCGTLNCSRFVRRFKNHHACMQYLQDHHKFYLAFENAHCDDYVTEKFFKVMDHPVVPVVFGGANYSNVAPYHSYINVLDFETIEDLVKYLKMLNQNDEKFAEYFWWKSYYRLKEKTLSKALCQVCQKLHDPRKPKKLYNNFEDWYLRQCHHKLYLKQLSKGRIELTKQNYASA